jgi:hypothetical protein
VKLEQESFEFCLAFGGGQGVGAEVFGPVFDLEGVEPLFLVGLQQFQGFLDREVVPEFSKQCFHMSLLGVASVQFFTAVGEKTSIY